MAVFTISDGEVDLIASMRINCNREEKLQRLSDTALAVTRLFASEGSQQSSVEKGPGSSSLIFVTGLMTSVLAGNVKKQVFDTTPHVL
jgi:hypothetical protein